ncbi:unnamed protein product, partial [Brenthis ino]
MALRALRGTGVEHRQLPNSRLLLRLIIQKDSITKLGPTRDSNPGPPGVQPYMLATTPPRQSHIYHPCGYRWSVKRSFVRWGEKLAAVTEISQESVHRYPMILISNDTCLIKNKSISRLYLNFILIT